MASQRLGTLARTAKVPPDVRGCGSSKDQDMSGSAHDGAAEMQHVDDLRSGMDFALDEAARAAWEAPAEAAEMAWLESP